MDLLNGEKTCGEKIENVRRYGGGVKESGRRANGKGGKPIWIG